MKILVTWGTKNGGTEGIARVIGRALTRQGMDVDLVPAREVRDVSGYQAAFIGGALYANRWHRDARRVVERNVAGLRKIPVWMFSSGPLDASADHQHIPPTRQVETLMKRIGACGHATFGGRLAPDAKGSMARAMAKKVGGDYRNPLRISHWATELAKVLPTARPRPAHEPEGRSPWRLLGHAVAACAASIAVYGGLAEVISHKLAIGLGAIMSAMIATAIAIHYFGPRGARQPLPSAAVFAATAAVFDAGLIAVLGPVSAWTGLLWSLGLIFLATWLTGLVMSTLPWPHLPKHGDHGHPQPL